MYVVGGSVLLLVSITHQIVLMEQKFSFTPGPELKALGVVGGVMLVLGIALGIALGVRMILDRSPLRAEPLVSQDAIYIEARRMVEGCKGHEQIRATSITTAWPGSDDPEKKCVDKFFKALAAKCAAAKADGQDLLYTTILGFGPGTGGIPPEHKKRSITKRREFFEREKAEDRLKLLYIETDWSLDVLIVGTDQMIIGFPTLPHDREFRLGLKIKDPEFVGRVVRWYDHCVQDGARELTWTQEH